MYLPAALHFCGLLLGIADFSLIVSVTAGFCRVQRVESTLKYPG